MRTRKYINVNIFEITPPIRNIRTKAMRRRVTHTHEHLYCNVLRLFLDNMDCFSRHGSRRVMRSALPSELGVVLGP